MDSTASPDTLTWLYWLIAAVVLALAIFFWLVIRKGRALPGDHVFRASRLGRGNRLLPAQVVVTHESVTFFKPQWIGKLEESIHTAHVASIKIDTHLILADVFIETTGGRDPIVCHGHTKHDAMAMKSIIEQFQSEYYRQAPPAAKS